MHVDQFIDSRRTDTYASWFLDLKRLPATLQFKFAEFIDQYQLYCTFDGERYRVTGASRLGDVWLTKDFAQTEGYQCRVDIAKCSQWSKSAELGKETETNTLLESHAELLAFTIAERDCFYDCCTDGEGNTDDPGDLAELARLDAIIDRARAAQKAA